MPASQSDIGSSVEERIATLSCWSGKIAIEPLKGGISNESYKVSDAKGCHVVRFGKDYPFHHVFRDREVMTARAAYAAGFAPQVEYSEPGVMVSAFINAKSFCADDVRSNLERVALLLRDFHQSMGRRISGAAFLFWPFQVVRDYANTLEAANSRMKPLLPQYLALADALESVQTPLPIIFAHNDLLPANIMDDGQRLWLIDFEYAGFSTAMFDLAGTASNAEFSQDESDELLSRYFGAKPDAALLQSHAAMQCASLLREAMWSMVSEIYLAAPGANYATYTQDNLDRFNEALDQYQMTYGKLQS
jgi:thiamine kinase-like enzyme